MVWCCNAPYGTLLAAPSAPKLNSSMAILLDCHDHERVRRLHARGTPHHAGQDMLSWAAWHRMHAIDPQWRPDVITQDSPAYMQWDRWKEWQQGNPAWRVSIVDTTRKLLDAVLDEVIGQIASGLRQERGCARSSGKNNKTGDAS
jgi:hypothetical protein